MEWGRGLVSGARPRCAAAAHSRARQCDGAGLRARLKGAVQPDHHRVLAEEQRLLLPRDVLFLLFSDDERLFDNLRTRTEFEKALKGKKTRKMWNWCTLIANCCLSEIWVALRTCECEKQLLPTKKKKGMGSLIGMLRVFSGTYASKHCCLAYQTYQLASLEDA